MSKSLKALLAGVAVLLVLSGSVRTEAVVARDGPQYVDLLARSEIAHLKELLAAADKRYEQRFNAQEGAVSAALAAQEKSNAIVAGSAKEAVAKAEIAGEKRFDSINEFRGQLRDQQTTFMTRMEVDQRLSSLGERVTALQARVDQREGISTGASNLWGYFLGGSMLIVAILGGVVTIYSLNRKVSRKGDRDA
jgi:hypothetical protein